MRIRKKLYSLLSVLFVLPLFSCFDMGSFGSEKEYVDAFDVYVTDGKTTEAYDLDDFFSDDSSNFILPDDFVAKEYKYLALKANDDVRIGQIAIFFSRGNDSETSNASINLKVNVSVANAIPTKIKDLDKNYKALEKYYEEKQQDISSHPNKQDQKDWDNIQPTFEESYDPSSYLAQESVTIKRDYYNHVFFEEYRSGDSFAVEEDKYILFEFVNNTDSGIEFTNKTTLEEAKAMIENRRAERTKIAFTDILLEGK